MLKYCKVSRYKLKKIIECFCLDLTAIQTSLLLQFNRNTIHRFYLLFRHQIYLTQENEKKKLCGSIEVDESYFGAKRVRGQKGKLKRGRGTLKQPVFGIFERKGRVYTEIVPDCRKATLQGIMRGKISLTSVIYSDSWRGYDGLVDVGYNKHFRVNHGKSEFVKNKRVHVNGIEAFWSFCKRRLSKFNGVKVNFDLHLKECEWRYLKSKEHLIKELTNLIL